MVSSWGAKGSSSSQTALCPRCGRSCIPGHAGCAWCAGTGGTHRLTRPPLTVPSSPQGTDTLQAHANIILQFFPSGACFVLPLQQPVILGRATNCAQYDVLDLSELNADRHGVSRQHCLLRRCGNKLVLVDLNSTNGTYLNGMLIPPQHEFVISEGDHLILGSLRMDVYFAPTDRDPASGNGHAL